MNAERLMDAATRRTGLADWGGRSFLDPLQMLVDSFQVDGAEADESVTTGFRREIVELLCTRLRIQHDVTAHADILDVTIRRPLVVVGLPRTGSTLLHHLLAQDPACRYLAFWELISPSPPPDASTRTTDPRIRIAAARLEKIYRRTPDLARKHETTATGPEECKRLFNYTFMNDFNARWPVTSYHRWLRGTDRTEAYEYYHRILQLLTWRCPGRHLVLKSPSHLGHLDSLFHVLPDANVVWLHRDPMAVIPSICSLRKTLRGSASPAMADGWAILEHSTRTIARALAVRAQQRSEQFLDVKYDELLSAPGETVRRIYQTFGYEYPDDLDSRIASWLAAHPKDRHGAHFYRLDEYGLDANEIAGRLSGYCERFGIAVRGYC